MSWTAFHGARRIDRAETADLLAAEQFRERDASSPQLLIFDDATGRIVDVDLRLSPPDILAGLDGAVQPGEAPETASPPRGPGRPKLGVVAREVTLLPRHWDWLAARPGGASVALRKLVDDARRAADGTDRIKKAQEAAYRFMQALAGDQPNYEDALRALYARDGVRFDALIEGWPDDVRTHARRLASPAFAHANAA